MKDKIYQFFSLNTIERVFRRTCCSQNCDMSLWDTPVTATDMFCRAVSVLHTYTVVPADKREWKNAFDKSFVVKKKRRVRIFRSTERDYFSRKINLCCPFLTIASLVSPHFSLLSNIVPRYFYFPSTPTFWPWIKFFPGLCIGFRAEV